MPDPHTYQSEVYAHGLHDQKPAITFQPTEWESLARTRLSANSYSYVHGSAGTHETDHKNRAAFQRWSIIPSRLIPSDFPSLSTTLFGEEYASPIAIAPVGVQTIFHPEGEKAVARAAAGLGVPYTLSTATATSIEDVAGANGADGKRWFQLYWPSNEHNDITVSLLRRAKAAGYTVLVVTLDTYILGWRPSDMDNGYNPFLRADTVGVEAGFSDPVFREWFAKTHGGRQVEEDMGTAAGEWTRMIFPGKSHGWEDLGFLKQHWEGPIVLKGIQSVRDARLAVEYGVQGIVVSNHGGRQLDGGVGSLTVLPEIVDAVGGEVEVLFDSGVRCGADVVKALALGAKMVLVGRPYVYGLAIGGEEGVRHVLRSLMGEVQLTLHLAGVKSVDKRDLNHECLRWDVV
ncbi:lactate 2-monooxygenase [Aspergillus ibericus CBS 121593]|uniref:FMN-dependent alpha-hydroxy acid dehydrogenase n=1 Tax=Aspergillus ibericus CBS 121593 TaxID=1448316 RepID=A0A395HEW7_9EURO|nr:FMN-dependent alpha-hydroxy acid dehydrogenase [Aspergillus ibericus CBS 121593]RAL06196.1 FMN-dependent alpha-hydroxy acid dehydrogenase [Aspergillus ibericus CBS 121593]